MRKKVELSRKSKIIRWTVVIMIIVLLLLSATDILINYTIQPILEEDEELNVNLLTTLLYYLEYPNYAVSDGVEITNDYIIASIQPTKEYLDKRYDCADFMTPSLIRLVYKYGDTIKDISPEGYQLIKDTLLGFKYWITDNGADSMCYWSENHQILFAVAEYLAGKLWPDEIFTNDEMTGSEHMERAEIRINYWIEHRFYYGFAEYNSTNYMPFNLGPMANLIEFSEDTVMVERMKMVMDLAIYDIASNMYNYTFMAPSARAYVYNLIGITGDKTRKFTDYIWSLNDDWKTNSHRMLLNFISMAEGQDENGNKYYEVPDVLLEIGKDTGTSVIKSSSGLYVSELEDKELIGQEVDQIMMQFGMEAFTNPEVLKNTITFLSDNELFSNSFLNYFKYLNLVGLKIGDLLQTISEKLNPMPNGVALQRANIYTYQTDYYQLATSQNYLAGSYGATQLLSIANFTENAVVFTSHPARYMSAKNVTQTPGYWEGYGRAPSSVQYENVQLSIYKLPEKSGFLELYDVPQFTHTYLPQAYFDEVIIDGKYAFARVGDAYLSLTGASDLEYLPFDYDSAVAFESDLVNYSDCSFDLVQNGLNQYWIYDLSDSSKETFETFMERIKANNVTFDGENNLTYESNGNTYALEYDSEFVVNGEIQDLEYDRFESEYVNSAREADVINFNFNGYTLSLDYVNAIRNYN